MEIYEARQWLVWMFDGDRKRCANVHGRWCASTDTTQYVTYAEAVEAADRHDTAQGPAFCFTADDPWVGIDLDDCLVHGKLEDWARPIVERFAGTYIEISPSFSGLKIYARGAKPAGKQSSTRVGTGAIEVYDRGRFFAFTAVRMFGSQEIGDCQEAIDWLYQEYFPRRTPEDARVAQLVGGGGDLRTRAVAYLDAAEVPGVGQRNSAMFRMAGHLHAMQGDDGELLAREDLFELLLAWNDRFLEPLDAKEVDSCVRNAISKGTPREPKTSTREIVDTRGVEQLMQSMGRSAECEFPEQELPVVPKRVEMPAHLFEVPGLIGEFVQYCRDTCHLVQPALFLAAGVCLQAVLAGRKVKDRFGNRPHVYFLCLAESGLGKDHARGLVTRICSLIGGYAHADLEAPRSGSALIRALANEPARIAMIDEFGRFLRFQKNSLAGFQQETIDHLLKLYSAGEGQYSGAQYADSKQNINVDRPSLSLLATTVSDSLVDNLSEASFTDGLMSRLLVLWGDDDPADGTSDPDQPVPESIRTHCQEWLTFGGNLGGVPGVNNERLVKHTPAAEELAKSIIKDARKLPAASRAHRVLRSRMAQNACKLALCYACSESSSDPVIDVPAVEWGYAMAEHVFQVVTGLMENKIAETEFHRRCIRVVEWLGDRGGEASLREMSRRFRGWMVRDRDDIVRNLVDTGQLEIFKMTSSGRPTIHVRLLSHCETDK